MTEIQLCLDGEGRPAVVDCDGARVRLDDDIYAFMEELAQKGRTARRRLQLRAAYELVLATWAAEFE